MLGNTFHHPSYLLNYNSDSVSIDGTKVDDSISALLPISGTELAARGLYKVDSAGFLAALAPFELVLGDAKRATCERATVRSLSDRSYLEIAAFSGGRPKSELTR